MSGICYLLNYLNKEGAVSVCFDTDVNNYINSAIERNIKENNYEFLYGLMGICTYLISIPGQNNNRFDKILSFLNSSKEIVGVDNCTFRWKSSNNNSNLTYNLSISHGMASIIVILSKICKQAPIAKELLRGAVNYIISQQIDVKEHGSYFSYTSDNNGPIPMKSRLGWCYGDLGISMSLWLAGESLEDISLKNLAVKILLHSADRRNLKDNYIQDAGLCHGTSGIAQIFYRMWWNTGIKEFKDATDYWIQKTLEMAKFENGLAGYKTLNQYKQWTNCPNLLEGISGIGLTLLYYLHQEEPDWDEILLIR